MCNLFLNRILSLATPDIWPSAHTQLRFSSKLLQNYLHWTNDIPPNCTLDSALELAFATAGGMALLRAFNIPILGHPSSWAASLCFAQLRSFHAAFATLPWVPCSQHSFGLHKNHSWRLSLAVCLSWHRSSQHWHLDLPVASTGIQQTLDGILHPNEWGAV